MSSETYTRSNIYNNIYTHTCVYTDINIPVIPICLRNEFLSSHIYKNDRIKHGQSWL